LEKHRLVSGKASAKSFSTPAPQRLAKSASMGGGNFLKREMSYWLKLGALEEHHIKTFCEFIIFFSIKQAKAEIFFLSALTRSD
jgi:hypothetical protein